MIETGQTEFQNRRVRTPDLAQAVGMEVLCACDGRFLPHTATMLCSLLVHNAVSTIYFFYSNVNDRDLAKLNALMARYHSKLEAYEIVPTILQEFRIDKHASIVNYYRLLAPQLLPGNVNKVLYLDSDIVVRHSLTELWNTDLTDYALAAVEDGVPSLAGDLELPVGSKYFNSGVMLIDLAYWRKNKVDELAIAFIRNNPTKVQYWDQDALNAILAHRWIELPDRWNQQTDFQARCRVCDPAIVHFCGGDEYRPWHWRCQHPLRHEYHQLRRKTPWRRYSLEGGASLPRRLYGSLRGRIVMPVGLGKFLRVLVKKYF